MKTLNDSIKESFEILLENISFKKPQGIVSGYPNFDNMMRGMNKGNLTVLASKPSLGKTAFALNIVHNLTKRKQETGIIFCSDLSNTELTFRLLTIASGVKTDSRNEDMQQLTSTVNKLKDYPLYFEEHSGIDDAVMENIKTSHAAHNIELLIVDNIPLDDCRKLKELAKELDITVLAMVSLYSRKDEILSRGIADTFVIIHRERKADYDPDLGVPVDLIISKNKQGLCGTCHMYFIPETMLFKESCTGEPFVAIPDVYEPITPYGELKKYLSSEKLPLLAHLRAEIPQEDETLNLSDILSLSARLEAVGDHENAVKVFLLGRKNCHTYEKGADVAYDLMFAAMYYWLFRDNCNALRCMEQAEEILDDEPARKEYRELQKRIKNYIPAEWIKDHEII